MEKEKEKETKMLFPHLSWLLTDVITLLWPIFVPINIYLLSYAHIILLLCKHKSHQSHKMNSSPHYDKKTFMSTCSFYFFIATRNFIHKIVKIVSTIRFWFKLSLELFRNNHMMAIFFGIVEGWLDKIL
jgi:hypothetical protein